MKKNLTEISTKITVFALLLGCLLITQACSAGGVKLQALNPRGEITLPPVSAPSNRIHDLADKKIGLYWNGKPGGNHFWNGIEQLLKEKLPNATVFRYEGAFDLGDAAAAAIAEETDAFLYGVGD
jgi:hypothetical protein